MVGRDEVAEEGKFRCVEFRIKGGKQKKNKKKIKIKQESK